ncbi:MAG: glycosyltransferase family 2 protein [Elusimicrobia bacterium]|nr:glycosyltransferase family 2 protein [Elusimicrobiota bacterium]
MNEAFLPLVSVVIDNYNYGRFLKQCLDSALGQDYPDSKKEVILVDDGSTDDSLKVAQGFGDRIKLIAQKNTGQAGAFNAGIQAARGEIVMFLDSDDYWDRDKMKVAAACFEDPSVGIVQHPLIDVDAQGRALDTVLPGWPPRYTLKDFLAGGAALAAASGVALRRSVLAEVGPLPLDVFYTADIYVTVHGLFVSDAVNLSVAKGYHRIHGQNNWAEGYLSPKKLRMGLELQRTFDGYLVPKLKARGLEFSPMYKFLEDLDVNRREILVAMHEGRRGEAFALWRQLFRRHGLTSLGFFRCSTLLLALVSPAVYIRSHELYRTKRWLVSLRGRILPDT